MYFKNVRDVTQILFESGIFHQNQGLSIFTKTGRYQDDAFAISFRIYDRKIEHVVLTWDYLYASFIVWFVAVIISILVFVGELKSSHKFKILWVR